MLFSSEAVNRGLTLLSSGLFLDTVCNGVNVCFSLMKNTDLKSSEGPERIFS